MAWDVDFANGADPSGRAVGVRAAAYGESFVGIDEKRLRCSGTFGLFGTFYCLCETIGYSLAIWLLRFRLVWDVESNI